MHGSWFGAWCSSSLIPFLMAKNITVVAPDLPGHATGARFPASFNQRPLDANAFAVEPSPLAGIGLSQYTATIQQTVDQLIAAGFGPITWSDTAWPACRSPPLPNKLRARSQS